MFRVRKWYLDCVTDDGTAFIGYAAIIRWQWFRIQHFSYVIAHASGETSELVSWRNGPMPKLAHGDIAWSNKRLAVHGEWKAMFPPVTRKLHEGVEWRCHQPGSRVTVRIKDRVLSGLGYAEELRLAIPPWRLPIEELEWGRYVSEQECMAWITWHGPKPLSLAFRNGEEVANCDLTLSDTRDLRYSSLAPLLEQTPMIGRVLSNRFGATLEHKMLSRGENGWVIHEAVKWLTAKQPA